MNDVSYCILYFVTYGWRIQSDLEMGECTCCMHDVCMSFCVCSDKKLSLSMLSSRVRKRTHTSTRGYIAPSPTYSTPLQVHEKKIGCIDIYPSASRLDAPTHTSLFSSSPVFTTASNDRTCKVWDLRKVKNTTGYLYSFDHGTSASLTPTDTHALTNAQMLIVRSHALHISNQAAHTSERKATRACIRSVQRNMTSTYITCICTCMHIYVHTYTYSPMHSNR